MFNNEIESLKSTRLVEDNIMGEMKRFNHIITYIIYSNMYFCHRNYSLSLYIYYIYRERYLRYLRSEDGIV